MLLDLGHSELVVLPDNYRHIKFLALRWCPEGTAGRGKGDKHYILPAPPPYLREIRFKSDCKGNMVAEGFRISKQDHFWSFGSGRPEAPSIT